MQLLTKTMHSYTQHPALLPERGSEPNVTIPNFLSAREPGPSNGILNSHVSLVHQTVFQTVSS